MSWFSSGKTNDELITNLKTNGLIKNADVEAAMRKLDRGAFVPWDLRSLAYDDSPCPIGFSATISAPHMHAMCLEHLRDFVTKKRGTDKPIKVLDVGSGSGFLCAAFALLLPQDAPPGSCVYGVEHIPQLVKRSIESVKATHPELLDSGKLKILDADGRWGLESEKPFACIHVGAAAEEGSYEKLIEQLDVGGRLIIPVGSQKWGQVLLQVDKLEDGTIKRQEMCGVRYVPLTSVEAQAPEAVRT